MHATLLNESGSYEVDMSEPIDISIHIGFNSSGIKAFGGNTPSSQTYRDGSFTGNVAQGGSCNCDTITITPHLNGTHTECVGHITKDPVYIIDLPETGPCLALLISITPQNEGGDFLITKSLLETALDKQKAKYQALIIRTLPNTPLKASKNYDKEGAPYFTEEAMRLIAKTDIRHLLVDFASIDKMDDGGKLLNHKIYWGVDADSKGTESTSDKTVTELVYIKNDIEDGVYLLDLQLAPFKLDAVPSRPILYRVKRNGSL
jgi:kynurenine formamidase